MEAYLLELHFVDGQGINHYYYFEHDMYQLRDVPTHRCLMELRPAKAKRTKILKELESCPKFYKGLKDVKIRKVTMKIGEEVAE